MKKGLIFGLIAVLSAALLVTGCSQSTDSGGTSQTLIGGRLVDIEVANEPALYAALNNPDYQIIGITTAIALATSTGASQVTEIPAGKTVVLYAQLTPPTDAPLTVNGTLIVEGAGILVGLHGTSEVEVDKGQIQVINGRINTDVPEAIHGVPVTQEIFGTGKVQFAGGTLSLSTSLTTLEKVKTVFGWVPHGTVILAGVDEAIKPSVLADAIAAFPSSPVRRLTITAAVPFVAPGDTAAELIIPAGLTFITADPFPSLTSLEVKGNLTASAAAFTGLTNLTVSGAFTAGNATYNRLTSLTVESPLAIGTPLTALKTFDVKNGGAFTGLAIGDSDLTHDGIAVTIAPKGAAAVTVINNLESAAIEGALTANSFNYDSTGSAPSPLSVSAGGSINGISFPAPILIPGLAANAVTIDDYEVPGGLNLTIAAGKTLTVGAGKTLTYEGSVTIVGTGNLILAATGSTGAKIAGVGIITVGPTTISGDWEAASTADGTVTILSGGTAAAPTGATITASAAAITLKASAPGASITQGAGANNALTISGANTAIVLGGTSTAPQGSIILTAAAANSGKLTFSDIGGKVLVGAATAGTAIAGVNTPTIGGKAIVITTLTAANFANDTGFLVLLGGTTAGNFTAGATDNVLIDSTVAAAGTP